MERESTSGPPVFGVRFAAVPVGACGRLWKGSGVRDFGNGLTVLDGNTRKNLFSTVIAAPCSIKNKRHCS